ncbi:MAG: glycine dehydrogenase subunit 2 [Hyphomicrobiaceae bacterium]|jgi:glycine dehydrogenase subunit 2
MNGADQMDKASKPDAKPAEVLEPVIFEKGSAGRSGIDVASSSAAVGDFGIDASLLRDELEGFPEVSEPELLRHYLRLSHLNFSAATNFYPLGSCTMKYNPVANERAAALPGFAGLHPYAPEETIQGALELIADLEHWLAEICGLDAVSLQPAAGAQGEMAGMKIIRAWHRDQGRVRTKVLIPESAHGTNPASAALSGYQAVSVPCDERGLMSAAAVRERLDEDVAALMVTNPSTLGLFETEITEIADAVHAVGGLVYMDGANMNALMGVAKPGHMGADVLQFNLHKTFSTPHGGGGPGAGPVAVRADLERYLPSPRLVRREGKLFWDRDRPESVGRVRSFYGNFGILVRAYTYMLACGGDGLTEVTRTAVIAANYIRARLIGAYHLPFETQSMHEVVFSDKIQMTQGVKTLDIAKRLLDHGFHAPTIYFPLVVHGALMIEPTESEPLETLDAFCDAMLEIAAEAAQSPQIVVGAPHNTPLARLDETRAARKPILRWTPKESSGD